MVGGRLKGGWDGSPVDAQPPSAGKMTPPMGCKCPAGRDTRDQRADTDTESH